MNTPFRIVASDLDGTLLDKNHKLADVTKETLLSIAARHDNVHFILATGRHYLTVADVLDDLRSYMEAHAAKSSGALRVPPIYLVSSNGARVHDKDGELVIAHDLDEDIVQYLYKRFGLPNTDKKRNCDERVDHPATPSDVGPVADDGDRMEFEVAFCTSAYTTDNWYASLLSRPEESMLEMFGMLPYVVPFDVEDPRNDGKSIFDSYPLTGVGKIGFWCNNRTQLSCMEREIEALFGHRVMVTLSSNFSLDVMRGGVSKAHALEEVAQRISAAHPDQPPFSLKDIIAFGDSMNDREMLHAAGKGCLMGNAQPRLKAALPHCEVLGHHHDDDGVATKLMEVFSLPSPAS